MHEEQSCSLCDRGKSSLPRQSLSHKPIKFWIHGLIPHPKGHTSGEGCVGDQILITHSWGSLKVHPTPPIFSVLFSVYSQPHLSQHNSFCLLCPTFYFLSPFSVSLSNFWRPTRFTYSSHVSFGRCLALARPEAPREEPLSTVLTDTSQVPGDAQMHHNSQIQRTYLKQKFYNSVEDFYFPLGNYFFFPKKETTFKFGVPRAWIS